MYCQPWSVVKSQNDLKPVPAIDIVAAVDVVVVVVVIAVFVVVVVAAVAIWITLIEVSLQLS